MPGSTREPSTTGESRRSSWSALSTSRTSVPGVASQSSAISFEKEMSVARSAFDAYFVSSALRSVVRTIGQSNAS